MRSVPPELHADLGRFIDEWLLPTVRDSLRNADDRVTLAAILELQIRADDGEPEVWHLRIADGNVSATPGPADKPDVIVKAHRDDGLALVEGDLDADAALTDGRLAVSGDVALATRVAPLLRGG